MPVVIEAGGRSAGDLGDWLEAYLQHGSTASEASQKLKRRDICDLASKWDSSGFRNRGKTSGRFCPCYDES